MSRLMKLAQDVVLKKYDNMESFYHVKDAAIKVTDKNSEGHRFAMVKLDDARDGRLFSYYNGFNEGIIIQFSDGIDFFLPLKKLIVINTMQEFCENAMLLYRDMSLTDHELVCDYCGMNAGILCKRPEGDTVRLGFDENRYLKNGDIHIENYFGTASLGLMVCGNCENIINPNSLHDLAVYMVFGKFLKRVGML
ncbi:MAG: hypothetical protein QXL94_01670 [Candidatus Parvarchaeum sp.]